MAMTSILLKKLKRAYFLIDNNNMHSSQGDIDMHTFLHGIKCKLLTKITECIFLSKIMACIFL